MILCTSQQLTEIWDRLLVIYPKLPSSAGFEAMTRRQKIFYLVFWLDCELQNGGVGP